nr:GNAT family N-acetyltransferase [Rhizomicrobium palustre]
MSQHKGALPREISSAENIRFAYRTDLRKVAETGVAQCVSRNTRQQLRRNLRDAGGNVAITAAKDKDEALAYFAELKALHIRSWEKRRKHHAFDNPIFEPFHHAVISTGIEDGSVELLRLEAGSRLLGYLYNFQRNGVVSSYQSGFAEEVARPGYLCHAAAMEHYAARGLLTYDFLAGTNQLKSSLGLERYELCWRRYRRPSLGVIAEQLAHWAVQRAKPAM